MENNLQIKLENLKNYLRQQQSVAIAFSSGVDSTFLLKVAQEVLGDKAVAITICSESFPNREFDEAKNFCQKNNIKQIFCTMNQLEIPGFKENPENRCYICKKAIFQQIKQEAAKLGISTVCEGSNMDDLGDYRPGLKAISELDIKSPLRTAELYKSEIRVLSKQMQLPTWDKPSYACLSTRLPYGEEITKDKLLMIDKGEQFLLDLGFTQMRVRIHQNVARIEIKEEEFNKLLENRKQIIENFKSFGFSYVAMDLQGYRTGSMNEAIKTK